MSRPKNTSRVTKPSKPVQGQTRRRRHGDHHHTEVWCENHQRWEQTD